MAIRQLAFWGTIAFILLISWQQGDKKPPAQPLSQLLALEKQFIQELLPLFQQSDCLLCHAKPKRTPLGLSKNPQATFRILLEGGYFDLNAHHSLYARLTEPDDKKRMPPEPHDRWTPAQLQKLKTFSERVQVVLTRNNLRLDEMFPLSLQLPFEGKQVQIQDTTFLTYTQLKGKIKTVFNDDWIRDERDRFAEDVAMFGGADFRRTFSETNRPTAQFLSGLDMLARDVVSRAYLNRTGPFQSLPDKFPDPRNLKTPDAAYRQAINTLYQRMLFRPATEPEQKSAFAFIQGVYKAQKSLTPDEYDLRLELTVSDVQGLKTTRTFTLIVLNTSYSLHQELIDQSQAEQENRGRYTLKQPVTLKANDKNQLLRLTNQDTYGVMSIEAIELKGPLPGTEVQKVKVTDVGVQLEGAWKKAGEAYHDNDENKGSSHVLFPLTVKQAGRYEISVLYRVLKDRYMATAVPVEMLSQDKHWLAVAPPPPVPLPGEAHYRIDQSMDTRPYWDSRTVFKFEKPEQGVELNNAGTRRTVVADAVRFVPQGEGKSVLVRASEAEGIDQWKEFKSGDFDAYNTVGPKLYSDENKRKGELKLLYRPGKTKDWDAGKLYRLQVHYPAREYTETRTPLIVRAAASSPIVQVRFPVRAHVGAKVELDASASYNVQHTPLKYHWRQVGGPRVQLANSSGAKVSFTAPALSPHQAVWEGLCQALMKHPDFLFTRPPSLAYVKEPKIQQRLKLVKIAQDLVGRPPALAELNALDKGTPLTKLVDNYLNSKEFETYYFRRSRLLLESHGTPEDDEPVRLWCYVAFNNRPFSEILTADYTVDEKMQRQKRPEYHGKTGLLTMKGFMKGKPGLPHFNYAAVVAEKFLGYVFEVPPEIVEARQTATAAATTQPGTTCYSCHKILTPLAYQRLRWTDDGKYRETDEKGRPIDDTDQNAVASYPFKGRGLEAFATQAVKKERFTRAMINTHFLFIHGREMRYSQDERGLYARLYKTCQQNGQSIKALLKALVLE
jgi:hypothetical protein